MGQPVSLRQILPATILLLASGAARATTIMYTGAETTFTAPTTGLYDITAYGASGGNASDPVAPGGFGAEIGGYVTLTMGQVLNILVGGAGVAGGGGGGSFVAATVSSPLIVAGGGGGAGGYPQTSFLRNGGPGLTGSNGGSGYLGGTGGSGGSGGGVGLTSAPAGAGGGFSSNGAGSNPGTAEMTGGASFLAGGAGGIGGGGLQSGGFGGGGGGFAGGGGGGGYSGGGAGGGGAFGTGGGGGGSYLDGSVTELVELAGENSGNGEVIITEIPSVPAPEPASLALLASAAGLLTVIGRRRTCSSRPAGPTVTVRDANKSGPRIIPYPG